MTSALPFPSDDAGTHGEDPRGDETLSFFDQPQQGISPALAADGSDPGVIPVALGGMAIVSGMVAILIALNGRLLTPLGLFILAMTAVLAYVAWRTRVRRLDVTVSSGIVYIESAETTLRFDLSSEGTRVEVHGQPEDADWHVTFLRRSLDPFVATPAMVDPERFLDQLRSTRPEL